MNCSPSKKNRFMQNRASTLVTKNHSQRATGFSNAFTLIELLVVIAVVAVLSAILMPVLSRVRQSSKQAQSISNLRQIAAAVNLYANDNGDLLPKGYFYLAGQGEVTYANQLAPYVNDKLTTLFISPTSAVLPVKPSTVNFTAITFSMNNLVCPDVSTGKSQVRRSSISHPSQVILIGDGSQNPTSTYSRCTFTNPPVSTTTTYNLDQAIPVGPDADTADGAGWLRYRNSGGVAVAMLDGHAEVIKKGAVLYRNVVPNW